MIYLGNSPVGVAFETTNIEGFNAKTVTVGTAIELGSDLATLIENNFNGDCEIVGVDLNGFEGDSVINRQIIIFYAFVENGSFKSGKFLRSDNGSWALYQMTDTYAAVASVGDKIVFFYKVVT